MEIEITKITVPKAIHYLILPIVMTFTMAEASNAQSKILEDVKRDPNEAIALCQDFEALNSKKKSASSKESLQKISQQKNMSSIDAEILAMYVRGLYCPEIF